MQPNFSSITNVAASYVHTDKLIQAREGLALNDSWLKWYNVATPESGVPADIEKLARLFLSEQSVNGNLNFSGELGFVILHRCGAEFYFLIVSTWRHENELWETVYAKENSDEPDFHIFPFATAHRGTFCVWELGAVWHEQQAWKRYLKTTRDDEAKREYLKDSFEGMV